MSLDSHPRVIFVALSRCRTKEFIIPRHIYIFGLVDKQAEKTCQILRVQIQIYNRQRIIFLRCNLRRILSNDLFDLIPIHCCITSTVRWHEPGEITVLHTHTPGISHTCIIISIPVCVFHVLQALTCNTPHTSYRSK